MINNRSSANWFKKVIFRIRKWNEKKSFKRKYQLEFLNKMVLLTKSGMPINSALRALSELDSTRQIETRVAADLATRVNAGEPLNVVMEEWFDEDISSAFSVNNHHSGAQESLLNSLIERSSWLSETLGRAFKATLYPFGLAAGAVVLMIMFGRMVLPSMTSRMDSEDIPDLALLLINSANFTIQYGLLVLALLLIGSFVAVNLAKNLTLPIRINTLDNYWPISVYKRLVGYMHFSQFLKMIEWGDTPLQASEKIKGYVSPYVNYHFDLISERASEGSTNLSELLDIPLLSKATKTQISLASQASTDTVANEIMKQIPAIMQIETQSVVNKTRNVIMAVFFIFFMATLLLSVMALFMTYLQTAPTQNIGY